MAEERTQRRLAAIMAADVVGYSRLMSEDETGTLTALKQHRAALIDPTIAEHRGRIVKLMGDGVLVEFASVVDAVECAVSIQRGMLERNADMPDARRITFRIGVNLGDIIIDDDDIYGDGVNVAARLEGLADPGGICVSASVHEQVQTKLDIAFANMGAQQVKNIAAPVRAYRVLMAGRPASSFGTPQKTDKPSIAVLPFDNLSGDPEQEYFSDGMAEDLITDLSKISSLSVAARNSSFSFKGQMADIKEVVEKLGVTFVLEGSVRKMGPKLRINAQLIDGGDGRHIWAERYDGDIENIFEFQDDIREQIVSALQVSLTPTDKALTERRPTDNVEAYDLFLKGRSNLFNFGPDHLLEAIKFLEKAIEIDPNFSEAYGYLSWCYFVEWIHMRPGFDDGLDRAHELAETGVTRDGTSPIALAALGWVQRYFDRPDQAVANLEKAIALDPNNAQVYAAFGQVLNWLGNPERGLEMLEKAFSIDTFAPPNWEFYAGCSHLLLRRYDEAIARFKRAIEKGPKFIPSYPVLAWAYVELGRLDDARKAIKMFLELVPQFTVTKAAERWPYQIDEDHNRFLDALRKSGMPEGDEVEDKPTTLPDKPSIAVLPFDNMSGDPEQEYFSDGMAEDIITSLSRIRYLLVTARNTTFAYKGQTMDVQAVASELGVRYVLEGSVRKSGDRVRITVQLIDGETGNHLWAERYDRDLEDIFAVQDEITQTVVGALQPELTRSEFERARRKPPESLDAWDLYQRGLWHEYRINKADNATAIELFTKAIALDPEFARPYAGLSECYTYDGVIGHTERDPKDAFAPARKAVEIDPQDASAHRALGWAHFLHRDHSSAIAELKIAIDLNPSEALSYAYLGFSQTYSGLAEEALESYRSAINLSPRDPLFGWFHAGMAVALLLLRRHEECVEWMQKALQHPPITAYTRLHLLSALGHLGRKEEAAKVLADLLEIQPNWTISFMKPRIPFSDDAYRDHHFEGLRKAGMPE